MEYFVFKVPGGKSHIQSVNSYRAFCRDNLRFSQHLGDHKVIYGRISCKLCIRALEKRKKETLESIKIFRDELNQLEAIRINPDAI